MEKNFQSSREMGSPNIDIFNFDTSVSIYSTSCTMINSSTFSVNSFSMRVKKGTRRVIDWDCDPVNGSIFHSICRKIHNIPDYIAEFRKAGDFSRLGSPISFWIQSSENN
jgi:hypothetical protein